MATRVRFPIRRKVLILVSTWICLAILVYLALAIKLFKEDKMSLVYELNVANVKTLAAEVEAELQKITDKVKLLTQGHQEKEWIRAIFESDPDLISYTLYQKGENWTVRSSVQNASYLKLYGQSAQELQKIRDAVPVPFDRIIQNGPLAINSTLDGGAPILTYALPIQIAGSDALTVAVVDLRLDRILSLLNDRGLSTVFLVGNRSEDLAEVIAHPDPKLVQSGSRMESSIVDAALTSPVPLQVTTFEWNGESWLGAYAKVRNSGMAVVSQIPEKEVFRAARRLIEKSILYALTLITIALLVSGRLARTLTLPLERLLTGTDEIARGQFGTTVLVKTRDEVGRLADAFNAMSGELKTQREQIEAHQRDLEQKVRDRTAELEQQKKKLAEAQDTLLRTTRLASLGEVAGATAHEVLNPVNNLNIRIERMKTKALESELADLKLLGEIIRGWTEAYRKNGWGALAQELQKPTQDGNRTLLEEDLENLSSVQSDYEKRIQERKSDFDFLAHEITRITRIVNNMRSLARVGGDRKPIDIHIPIEDTLITLSDLFEKHGVQVVRDFGSGERSSYQVVADKDELVQVFSNLLRNGLHAILSAKQKNGKIGISSHVRDGRVYIRISDNGTGIPAENLPRLFEPDFTTKSIEEGTGLGLSISRRLVRAFDGELEIESTQPGDGTTFLISFPQV